MTTPDKLGVRTDYSEERAYNLSNDFQKSSLSKAQHTKLTTQNSGRGSKQAHRKKMGCGNRQGCGDHKGVGSKG